MYIHSVTLFKGFTVIAEEVVALDEERFSLHLNPSFSVIKPAMLENGWTPVCNHTFEKDGYRIEFRSSQVTSLRYNDKQLKARAEANTLVITLMDFQIFPNRISLVLSRNPEI